MAKKATKPADPAAVLEQGTDAAADQSQPEANKDAPRAPSESPPRRLAGYLALSETATVRMKSFPVLHGFDPAFALADLRDAVRKTPSYRPVAVYFWGDSFLCENLDVTALLSEVAK